LKDLQNGLVETLQYKENYLKTMKSEFTKYENEQNTRSMQLNNQIAQLKMKSEKIDDEKTTLKN
jgi:predicted nuclease with TOPRIM domain